MLHKVTKGFIEAAIDWLVWDFGNDVLYDLCRDHPDHADDGVIIGKIWLIGRSYAAAIERRNKNHSKYSGDQFYEKVVAPKIKQSEIDWWFKTIADSDPTNSDLAIKFHKKLMDLFREISGKDKRSLASKYLHFHFPDRFYIYDSRAQKAIVKLTEGVGRKNLPRVVHDPPYAKFFLRCLSLVEQITPVIGRRLSPRELDKVLLASLMLKKSM
ncbi:MAG: hypothetical protein HY204_04660 [Nitrospirae bacterium]|nr:hypothetical protein [Nitrospirota bacterium]